MAGVEKSKSDPLGILVTFWLAPQISLGILVRSWRGCRMATGGFSVDGLSIAEVWTSNIRPAVTAKSVRDQPAAMAGIRYDI